MRYLFFLLVFSFFSNCNESDDTPQNKEELNEITVTKICDLPPEAYESSGILFWKGLLWTINDSGNDPELIAVDTSTGDLSHIIEIEGAENTDWEALYQDADNFYIADNGNNSGSRNDYQIYIISKDSLIELKNSSVYPTKVINYSLSDSDLEEIGHDKKSFDSEAIIVENQTAYVYLKDWLRFKTHAFIVDLRADTVMASLGGEYNLGYSSTASVRVNERTIAFLGYRDYRSFLTILEVNADLNGEITKEESYELIALSGQQTEGLTYSGGSFYVSCETISFFSQALFRIDLPVED